MILGLLDNIDIKTKINSFFFGKNVKLSEKN